MYSARRVHPTMFFQLLEDPAECQCLHVPGLLKTPDRFNWQLSSTDFMSVAAPALAENY